MIDFAGRVRPALLLSTPEEWKRTRLVCQDYEGGGVPWPMLSPRVAKRSPISEDQIRAAVGGLFLLLALMYVFGP